MTRPIAILIAALGGEGGGVLAEWLIAVATDAGYPVQSTSIPGVAQRTGATTYYVEIWPQPIAALGGRRPVLSLVPVPGCVDLVAASELLEAVRTAQSGMVSPDRTLLVTSTSRTLTTAEKMPPGDGRYDSTLLLAVARRHCRELAAFDMETIARDAGTVVSAVMLGAIAATGVLPFGRDCFEAVIRGSDHGAAASLAGFARAWEAMQHARDREATVPAAQPTGDGPGATHPAEAGPGTTVHPAGDGPATAAIATFPAAVRDVVEAGYARLAAFQDRRYADLYLRRLSALLAAERRSDPHAANGLPVTRETARFLALWMAFDDIVRVAQLKCRASRFARVRRELAAGDGDVVRIVDYFRPGVPEFSSLLPLAPARRLAAWERRRAAAGKGPLSIALTLPTDSVLGFFALRVLASLTWLRWRGARFAQEQALIERWLAAIERAAGVDWQLAHEIALCGRLIKGYGATNARSKEKLAHILDHLVEGGGSDVAAQRASAVRAARDAALADDDSAAFDRVLARHGAPPGPVAARPVRWMNRRPAEPGGRGGRAP